jgi:starch synthase
MDILMVAAELAPYVRETPAADAIAALCKALRQLGHDVTLAVPRHPGFEAGGLLVARRLSPLPLPSGAEVTVLDGQLASGTKLVLFDAPVLFERSGVYEADGDQYPDNAKRFGLLGQAAAALARYRAEHGDAFDVLHLHDWPGALVPIALRQSLGPKLPSVLTIHDGRRDGSFSAKDADALGIPRELATPDGVKLGAKINVLKGGIAFSDAVTSVSPTYARELADGVSFGALGESIAAMGRPIVGITNGIDYATYNPATDPSLTSRYDAEDPANKGRCKTAALRDLSLELVFERPLVLMTGTITKERGFDVIGATLTAILKNDVAVVVAGQGRGDAELEANLVDLAGQNPDRLAIVREAEGARLRKLYAAADLVLIAPRHEPCGDAQLIAQRYGAPPIAHATGGIQDTIVDCDAQLETGTGFLFDKLTQKAVLGAVQRGLAAYHSPAFPRLVRRVMRLDLAWDRPARRYLQIYRQTLAAS